MLEDKIVAGDERQTMTLDEAKSAIDAVYAAMLAEAEDKYDGRTYYGSDFPNFVALRSQDAFYARVDAVVLVADADIDAFNKYCDTRCDEYTEAVLDLWWRHQESVEKTILRVMRGTI